MKPLISFSLVSLVACSALSNIAYADSTLKTNKQKYSYAIGVQVANNLKNNGVALDAESLTQAVKDVLNGNKLQATPAEQNKALAALAEQKNIIKQKQAKLAVEDGKSFLAKNKKKKGVVTLKNGMQYKIIKKANGKKPKSSDTIVAHYEGKLIKGNIFDSSYKRGTPATFPVNAVIKGWQKIIPMMPVGSIWEVVIPPELAYGSHGAGRDIGPNETLIFKIELISIKS